MAEEKVYLVSVQKVTSLSGESVQINFNIPRESSKQDIVAEVKKVCDALDERLIEQNEKVLAINEKMKAAYESMGIEDVDRPNGKTH